MGLPQPGQRGDFDRRMADDLEQRLMTPDVAFERRDIEIADDDRGLAKALGPPRHALDEIELLAEFRVLIAVGDIAPGGDIDILKPDAAIEPDADVSRFAIV